MAKAGTVNATFPEFKTSEMKLPKFDLDAVFALQTANLAAAHEVQTVVLEAIHAIAKIQHGWVEENVQAVKSALSVKGPKQPQQLLADVKTAAEKAVAVGKQGVDLGVAAQQRVTELVAKRVRANIDEFKALAA